MACHHQLCLEHYPWPVSLLKFNRAISAMGTGDKMIATLRDPDVVKAIGMLLDNQPDHHYQVRQTDTQYRIQVIKGDPAVEKTDF